MKKNYQNRSIKIAPIIFSLISKVADKNKRNILRGYYAREHIGPDEIAILRANNSAHDNLILGAILKGPQGLSSRKSKITLSSEIYTIVKFPPLDWRGEACFTVGYLNSMEKEAVALVAKIKSLAFIENMASEECLEKLHELSAASGASNYLSYKLAYLKSTRDLSTECLNIIAKIEENFKHRESPGFHFSALENLSSKISLFQIARRRIGGLSAKVGNTFRSSISLSNFVPTPLGHNDIAGFLLRGAESSLIDTLYAVITLFNLESQFPEVCADLKSRLSTDLKLEIESLLSYCAREPSGSIVTDFYQSQNKDSEPSLDYYRVSSAFLERKKHALYRNQIDQVIGQRLLTDITQDPKRFPMEKLDDKELVTAPNGSEIDVRLGFTLDSFYRTYLFLRFISDYANLITLETEEIKFIFENTLSLESLMLEDEIQALYLTAPKESKGLVAVLSLALFRKKSIDPDVDFEFRSDFISHVSSEHSGSILNFIQSLLSDSPSVANYIISSLDETTLEKMYTLVKNASQASIIRGEILREIGVKLNRIEYLIEADAIVTRSKVATLQQYFDTSRMYVDSVAMKKWLDSNPSVFTEQYRDLYPKMIAKLSSLKTNSTSELNPGVVLIEFQNSDEYLVGQMAKEAFEQFCLNDEFGIQSYLGRRIRHNTLHGVMTETVDAVFEKEQYRNLLLGITVRGIAHAWLSSYKALIEKLRKEQLQFKSHISLFNAKLDLQDATTKENIRQLASTLRSAGGAEVLNDLIIAFCWKQITPQLENASRYIKTTLLNEANNSIEQHFVRHSGPVENGLKADLRIAINEVFRKVASWFQVPQTGFISASVRELCQIIIPDLGRSDAQIAWFGPSLDKKYTGISVHRIYDCLAVLLQNAFRHGSEGHKVSVDMQASSIDFTSLDYITVRVSSAVSRVEYLDSKARIETAIDAKESGADMVNEGYSGIKKIKFITRLNEGIHTVCFIPSDDETFIAIEFSLRCENLII